MSARRSAVLVALAGALTLWAAGCEQEVGLGPGRNVATTSSGAGGAATFGATCNGCGTKCVLEGGLTGLCDPAGACVSGSVSCKAAPACSGAESCGAPCDPCAGDPSCEGEPGFCQLDGSCSGVDPACPSPACLGQTCGTPCDPCAPGDDTCPPPVDLHVCDDLSACRVAAEVKCDPCVATPAAKKLCGEPCDPSCQPWDPGCTPDASTHVCDASGQCVQPAYLATCSMGYEPCGSEAKCGQPCSLCDPLDPTCVVTQDLFCSGPGGTCGAEPLPCAQESCASKPCGSQCNYCWPSDPDCEEMFCDASGYCSEAEENFQECPGADPCSTKICGAPCTLCASGPGECDTSVFLSCGDEGKCTTAAFQSCDDGIDVPCGGKTCGEACADDCDPLTDANCVPAIYKTCDPTGACVENAAPCR